MDKQPIQVKYRIAGLYMDEYRFRRYHGQESDNVDIEVTTDLKVLRYSSFITVYITKTSQPKVTDGNPEPILLYKTRTDFQLAHKGEEGGPIAGNELIGEGMVITLLSVAHSSSRGLIAAYERLSPFAGFLPPIVNPEKLLKPEQLRQISEGSDDVVAVENLDIDA